MTYVRVDLGRHSRGSSAMNFVSSVFGTRVRSTAEPNLLAIPCSSVDLPTSSRPETRSVRIRPPGVSGRAPTRRGVAASYGGRGGVRDDVPGGMKPREGVSGREPTSGGPKTAIVSVEVASLGCFISRPHLSVSHEGRSTVRATRRVMAGVESGCLPLVPVDRSEELQPGLAPQPVRH